MGTAVVTGAASGIGAAVKARLEAAGDTVCGVDVQQSDVVADLSTAEGRAAALAEIKDRHTDGLDRFVACAGLGPTADPATVVSVNFFGAVELLDGLLPLLSGRPGAAGVVISSHSAVMGPDPEHGVVVNCLGGDEAAARAAADNGIVAYALSKYAVARAVRERVEQWGGEGVRLNAVAPGPVETPLLDATMDDPLYGPAAKALPVPVGHFGSPEDLANVVAFLLGPEASYVHGAFVVVDGGTDALLRPGDF